MYDLLVKNAIIVDGSGVPGRKGNVAIHGGTLHLNADYAEAKLVIDAAGQVLCPGFIDAHSHGDRILGTDFGRLCKTSQGITTEITGQCGSTVFPIVRGKSDLLMKYLGAFPSWITENMEEFTTFKNFLEYANKQPLTANCLMLTGHTALRIAAMGYDKRKPTPAELSIMKELLRESLEHGSLGLSSGLLYSPSGYADIDEIAALCEVVAEYEGLYTTHMRDESSKVIDSVKESLEVVRRTGVRLFISHHKICGKNNWGLSKETLSLIDNAVAEGYHVTFDVYPYTASMSKLSVCLPTYCFSDGIDSLKEKLKDSAYRSAVKTQITGNDPAFDGRYRHCGGFSGILISNAPFTRDAEGMTIAEYAQKTGMDEFDAYFHLIIENGNSAFAIYYSMSNEDLFRIVKNPNAVVGSDGVVSSMTGKTHPRGWGTFPRAIKLYVKEQHIFTLPEMIRRMTSLTAERLGLKNRGKIAEGFAADLVILNPDRVGDTATYAEPTSLCEGIDYVIVDGQIVYHNKELTGVNSGKLLFRP